MDACEALLVVWKEDDGLPCYHLMEQYSTDVLGAWRGQSTSIGTLAPDSRQSDTTGCFGCFHATLAAAPDDPEVGPEPTHQPMIPEWRRRSSHKAGGLFGRGQLHTTAQAGDAGRRLEYDMHIRLRRGAHGLIGNV